VHAGSVGAQVGATAVQEQVEALFAPSQHEGARRGGHGLFRQVGRDADNLFLPVHPRVVVGEDLQRSLGWEVNTHLVQQTQCPSLQGLKFLLRQQFALEG